MQFLLKASQIKATSSDKVTKKPKSVLWQYYRIIVICFWWARLHSVRTKDERSTKSGNATAGEQYRRHQFLVSWYLFIFSSLWHSVTTGCPSLLASELMRVSEQPDCFKGEGKWAKFLAGSRLAHSLYLLFLCSQWQISIAANPSERCLYPWKQTLQMNFIDSCVTTWFTTVLKRWVAVGDQ